MNNDLQWAQERPTSVFKDGPGDCRAAWSVENRDNLRRDLWMQSLNSMEHKHLAEHEQLHPLQSQYEIVSLKDNPSRKQGGISKDGILFAVIANCGLLVCKSDSLAFPRWLGGSETLAAMGVRLQPKYFANGEAAVSSFNWARADRDSNFMRKAAGNGMFIYALTVVQAYGWLMSMREQNQRIPRPLASTVATSSFFSMFLGHNGRDRNGESEHGSPQKRSKHNSNP